MAVSITRMSSQRLAEKFANENNLKLHVVDIEKEYGHSIPVLSASSHRGHGKPCAVCGLAKRHEMNCIARDLGYDVLATGHNLDDEAAVLFGKTLTWSGLSSAAGTGVGRRRRTCAQGEAVVSFLRARDDCLCHRARH